MMCRYSILCYDRFGFVIVVSDDETGRRVVTCNLVLNLSRFPFSIYI